MDYKALGRNIKSERLKLGLTQEQLAEEVALTTSYIGQIERGEKCITLDKLVSIVNRLGITLDYAVRDSITDLTDKYDSVILDLLRDKTTEQKIMAVNVLKLILNDTDKDKEK